jgi:hypothetical protein
MFDLTGKPVPGASFKCLDECWVKYLFYADGRRFALTAEEYEEEEEKSSLNTFENSEQ